MYRIKRKASRLAHAANPLRGVSTHDPNTSQNAPVASEDAENGPDGTDAQGAAARSESAQNKRKGQNNRKIGRQLRLIFLGNWLNLLLIFVPIGIAADVAGLNPVIVFIMNFIAIIPLAGLLSYGTEELSLYVGETLGGLLNASFGNAVELIVSVIALVKREILIVQTSLIGSVLSNLLLVLGMAFVAGGFNRIEQEFNMTVAQASSGLLFVAVGGLIIPTLFHRASSTNDDGIVQLSRATAVILLLVYGSYLFFQLKSHRALFAEVSGKNEKRDVIPTRFRSSEGSERPSVSAEGNAAAPEAQAPPTSEGSKDEAPEAPDLPIITAVLVLLGSTALVAVCAEFLVSSINALVETGGVSRVFVGLILLPIVGNAAEHYTAVVVATKDKMDLTISVAVGSSLQIALLVIPFIVVLGWIMGIDAMTLYFDDFQVGTMFLSVLLVNYLIQDGKSNYLEGNLLMAVYMIIAVAAWFYPKSDML